MRKKSAILILVIAVTVNLSNGYSIKQPDSFSGSFSGSSSSSSAYSHASSSSYNFNGNIDPNAVEGLKDVLKAGAVAGASAGAVAGAGSGSLSGASAGSIAGAGTHGALSGASAGSIAGAGTHGALSGASAGSIAGAGAHGALSGAGALAQAGAVSSSGSLGGFGGQAGAGATAGALGGHLGGTNTGSETVSGTSGSSGCSGDSACGSGQDVNAIGGSSEDVDSGAYKVIGSDKYTSGYTSGAKTNYAVSDNYVQGTQHAAGGCVSCKGQFPGPNGSINDYKLASSVPAVPNVVNVPIVQPVQSSGGSSGAHAVAGAGGSTSYQPVASVNNLPGSSGSIYNSKPAVGYNVPSINSGSHSTGFASGHVSPSLIATLPGPSGSIYDSKPANAGAVAAAGAAAVSGAQAGNGGSYYNVAPSHPVVVPSCSFTPGSPNKNCGATPNIVPGKPFSTGSGLSGIIPSLPGPSGSIYDSKPATSVPLIHGAGAVAGSGASSGSYNGAGSVANIPSTHPVVGPVCSYTPGSPNKCGSPVAQNGGQFNAIAGANANAAAQAGSGAKGPFPGPTGSIHDYKPATAVLSGGGIGNIGVGSGSSSSTGCLNCKGPFPGPNGSIHDYKPASQSSFASGNNINYHGGSGIPMGSGVILLPHPIGCLNCIDRFPGSVGIINDYWPASSLPISLEDGSASFYAGVGSFIGLDGVLLSPIGSGVSSGTYNGAGSISQQGGQTGVGSGANANANAAAHAVTGGCLNCKGPFPGPNGSIHDYKPASQSSFTSGNSINFHGGSGIPMGSGVILLPHPIGCLNCIDRFPGSIGIINDYWPASSLPISLEDGSACFYAGVGSFIGLDEVLLSPIGSGVSSGTYNGAGSILQHGGQTGVGSGANANAAAHAVGGGSGISSGSYNGAGSVTNIPATHPVVGPACSYSPGSPNKCGVPVSQQGGQTGAGSGANANAASYAGAGGTVLAVPSIHPEAPSAPSVPSSGTYYINKPGLPSTDVQPPLVSSSPSFSGQIPCADSSCGSIQKTPSSVPVLQSGNCGSGSTCGSQAGSFGGSYAGSQGSSDSGIVYVDNDHSGQYQSINHDKSHLSGGIVYQNDDGSYDNSPTTGKSVYKNAQNGAHAVSSNNADNTGILIGPGTGHLPIEADAESKPFGTQGAFGGSAAFAKGAAVKNDKPFGTQGAFGESSAAAKGVAVTHDKPFGTQGAFGGSAAFAKSSASAQSSESQSQYGHGNGFATGDVTIQKSDGTQISPIDNIPGNNVAIGSGSDISSNSVSGSGYSNGQFNKNDGSPVKLQCTGASCGDTEVYVISEEPGSYGSQSGSGSSSNAGFATGQVLVNQGANTYDVTNSGANANALGGSYSGSQAGAYSGSSQFGSPGCITGQCGGQGFGVGGSFGIPSSGGFLGQLFGAGGLSGTLLNKLGGGGYGGSGAYSNAGSYAGASAGSYASAGASASAHAGSFASSF